MLPYQPTRFPLAETRPLTSYWTFYREVASAQLASWLPRVPSRILDLSWGHPWVTPNLLGAGHEVVRVVDRTATDAREGGGDGKLHTVVGDSTHLPFLADASVDGVVAEGQALSFQLATETTVDEVARVLRPDGRLLLCVDSLVLGMASLAEQQRWAQLSDMPSADVVLVPSPDGTITRCFWPDDLNELLRDAGLEVEWIRPRTVMSPSMVEQVLENDPQALSRLVETELSVEYPDGSVGIHLVASARRPRPLPHPRTS